MTTADLIQRLPQLREIFPKELVLEWPMADYLRAEQQQRAATLAGVGQVAAVYFGRL
jgi:hypothetical protein